MSIDEIYSRLKETLGDAILELEESPFQKAIKVQPEKIGEVIQFIKEQLHFETLGDLCAVDYPALPAFAVVYHMQSYQHKAVVRLKCYLPRSENAEIPSITYLFKAANWLEREAFDMMGIKFTGHPELRRILCPEDWTGHPLRKDYQTPDYYNGMPVPLYFGETNS